MWISELSQDLRPTAAVAAAVGDGGSHLEDLEISIKEAESLSHDDLDSSEKLAGKLRTLLSRLLSPHSESSKIHLWKLSYRLWNACIDLSNAAGQPTTEHAELRQIAAELLLLAGNPSGIPSPSFKSASFFHKTGLIWHELRRLDLAAACFEKATDLTSSAQINNEEEKRLLLDLNLARARTAWEASDGTLAVALLARSKNLLFGLPAAYEALAEQYLQFGKTALSKGSPEATDASVLLSEGLELCEKGIEAASRGRSGEIAVLEGLKQRCLRFLMAERLKAEDFEGVLRCVRVLRGEGKGADHPSVGFSAMRAWIGAGRVGEAERELKGMMVNMEVPESVCVSAAEAYLAAAGPEAAMGVLMGLMGRCRAGAGAALRVVRKVAEGGGGGRAKVVAELVSDERVVGMFEGNASAKERNAMHALLWNYGAEHFRSKEYQASSEMFERSMLYVPRIQENRTQRSHCFRVLGLCYIALSQLDQAQEFLDESEKLDSNIKTSFLKLKVYLQKKDEKAAINQMQAMLSCNDFDPEYLTLSTHEAIACRALPVAIASLSTLLSLYSPGKTMPMTEAAVLRNLITLLLREHDAEHEILKYTKRVWMQLDELGVESFFGNGAVGGRELSWFAGMSWNMGLKTGMEKKFECCAEFFKLAADFYRGDGSSAIVARCLILSVSAMINMEEQTKAQMPDSDVKKAIEMLNLASKVYNQTPMDLAIDDQQEAIFFMHTFCICILLGRLDDATARSQQLQAIKSFFAGSRSCSPMNLLQLALTVCHSARPNIEAAEFALNSCLSTLLASSSPDYKMVGVALRRLAGLAGLSDSKNEGVYGVYKKAYSIIVGLKDGEYPVEEGKWLAMTAWNRAGMAVRLRQGDVARRWMKMGLDLARRLSGMDKYRSGMEECLSNFDKVGDGGGASVGDGGSKSQLLSQ